MLKRTGGCVVVRVGGRRPVFFFFYAVNLVSLSYPVILSTTVTVLHHVVIINVFSCTLQGIRTPNQLGFVVVFKHGWSGSFQCPLATSRLVCRAFWEPSLKCPVPSGPLQTLVSFILAETDYLHITKKQENVNQTSGVKA